MSTSPIRCCTVKEYKSKLTQLCKDNFNLKLRIYFMEERMGYMNVTDDKEDLVTKNIELKVKCSFPIESVFYWSMQLV
jgi:centrosomin